jgi:hypothetical protein
MNPKPDKFIPALYGGIIMALVSTIPFISFVNCLCCAGIMLGGFLAVFFYKNNFTPDTPPFTSGDCMIVGLIAGNIGAVAASFLSLLFLKLFGNVMLDAIMDWLRQMNVDIPKESWDALESARAGHTGLFTFLLQMVGNIFIYGVFGLVGGLIGYSVYKPKGQSMMPPPPHHQTPMPPPVS